MMTLKQMDSRDGSRRATLTAGFDDDYAPRWIIEVTDYDDDGSVMGRDEWGYLDHEGAVTAWHGICLHLTSTR